MSSSVIAYIHAHPDDEKAYKNIIDGQSFNEFITNNLPGIINTHHTKSKYDSDLANKYDLLGIEREDYKKMAKEGQNDIIKRLKNKSDPSNGEYLVDSWNDIMYDILKTKLPTDKFKKYIEIAQKYIDKNPIEKDKYLDVDGYINVERYNEGKMVDNPVLNRLGRYFLNYLHVKHYMAQSEKTGFTIGAIIVSIIGLLFIVGIAVFLTMIGLIIVGFIIDLVWFIIGYVIYKTKTVHKSVSNMLIHTASGPLALFY